MKIFQFLPLTTHIALKHVAKNITFKKIEMACKNINYFLYQSAKKKKN